MTDDQKEIRKILETVSKEGAYHTGHIIMIENIAQRRVFELQSNLRELLNINDCTHDC